WVGEPVQPFARARVLALRRDRRYVRGSQTWQPDPVAVEECQRQFFAVKLDTADARSGQIDERFSSRLGAVEVRRRQRPEAGRGAVQVKFDPVGTDAEQPGALSRFRASQIASQP